MSIQPTTDALPQDKLPMRLARLQAVLSGGAYTWDNEKQLQDQLERRIKAAGLRYQRETALGKGCGTPDFLIGRRPWIVLEVKVRGSRADLLRQIDKYLGDGRTGACLVATTRSSHRDLPATLRKKHIRVSWLSTGSAFGGATDAAPVVEVPTVGQLVRVSGGWAVTLEAHAMGRFKRVFPRVGRKHLGTVPLDFRGETCRDLIWYMNRFPMQMTELDRLFLEVQADKYDRQRARVAAVAMGTIKPRAFTMAIPAREYQKVAAEQWLQAGGLLCADDLGLGKTITGIAGLTDPSTRPALVVTETHLCAQWQRELRRFAPGLVTHVITKGTTYDVTRPKGGRRLNGDRFHVPETTPGMVGDRPFPDVLITTYSKLCGWVEVLEPILKSVIYDEVQALRKGDTTIKGKAAYFLSRAVLRCLGLSATPIYNYGDEVWAVMEALCPGALGTRAEFLQEWCSVQGENNHRVQDPKALGSWLRSEGYMVRRTRADVGRELPPLHKVPWLVDANMESLDKVKKEVADLARAVLGDDTPFAEKGRAARELSVKMRMATGIAKAPYVAAFVEHLLQDGAECVVMFGWHREVYRIWMSMLQSWNPVLYTGSETAAGKERSRLDFIESRSRILIMSLRSGAGLDGLQGIGCKDVVFGELDWSPKVHDQCSGRVHRDGQPESVTAWYLHTDGGSDPVVLDILGVKRAQSAGLLDPTGQNPEAPADGNRAKALARRMLGIDAE